MRALLIAGLVLWLPGPVVAHAQDWTETKCEFYKSAWLDERAHAGDDVSPGFIASQNAFIVSGCTARADVCPSSQAEIDIANRLTIIMMNHGAASTFLPFACRG